MRFRIMGLVLVGLIGLAALAGAANRRLILWVETAPLAWGDSSLTEQLVRALGRNPDLRIVTPDRTADDQPPFRGDHLDIDSLLDWGTEIGGHYLLVVSVHREELQRRKTFGVPLLMQRWETIGVIEGELRLLDLKKRRQLAAEPFLLERSGSRQFQAEFDNNRNDPSLHLAATEKGRLFQVLERELAASLVEQFDRFTRGR